MSQSGAISNTSPIIPGNVPIDFVTDVGGPATSVGNVIVFTGDSVAAGSLPLFTSGSGNTVTYNIQKSQAIVAADATKVGVAAFDASSFAVDADGFVTIIGSSSPFSRFLVQAGTSPVVPSGGTITFNGAVVAAGTTPVQTDGTGANTVALEVQTSQALAAADATKIGLANFDSASFTVDANGFVSLAGSGPALTITGNSGGALPTSANNWNIVGSGSITNAGAGSTLTVQLTGLTNHAVLVGAGTATITKVGPTATAGQVLQSAGAAADPAFSTATYPSTTTVSQILYSSSTNVVSGLVTANRAVLTTGATGIPVLTALATNGQLIIGSTAGVPASATLTAGTGITITNASNSITIAANGSVVGQTITGDSGGPLSPTAGNWNLLGNGSITTSGAGSTLTTQLTGLTNHSVLVGAGTTTITKVAPSATSGVPLISQGAAADPVFGTAVVAGGGTGAITLTNHGVLIGQGTSAVVATAAGTAGQVLQSGGAGSDPGYSTPTYPSASGTARKLIVSDGTNNVYTTETWAVPGTSGNVLTSDGTNWTSTAPSANFSPNSVITFVDDFISAVSTLASSTIIYCEKTWLTPTRWIPLTSAATSSNPGVISIGTATGNNFLLASCNSTSTNTPTILLGGGVLSINWVVKVAVLSTITNRFVLRCGLSDGTTSEPSNGVWMAYSDSLNSGNWQGVSRSAGSSTTANSAVAVGITNFINLGVTVNAAATSVSFFVNGVEIANSPVASNIPTAALTPFLQIDNVAGANPNNCVHVDLVYMIQTLTTPR